MLMHVCELEYHVICEVGEYHVICEVGRGVWVTVVVDMLPLAELVESQILVNTKVKIGRF